MKKTHLLMLLVCYLLASCAGVKIYSDAALSNKTALKFYYAKPYLLVEKNANKDGSTKTSIIYLPDLTEPYFAKTISGLGTNELKLAFENGAIASYGLSTDTKIPESAVALTGLLTGLNKLSTIQETDNKNKLSDDPNFELYAIQVSNSKMVLKKVELKKE